MRRINLILSAAIIFIPLITVSCKGSVRERWSERDKKNFRRDLDRIDLLSSLGDNKIKWIECYLSKCEAIYTSYNEAYNDEKGFEEIALECSDEVLSNGSVRGKWSEIDKQYFYKDMETIKVLSNLGDNKTKWIECYLNKCEVTYSSYYESNSDIEGCERIALECTVEIFK